MWSRFACFGLLLVLNQSGTASASNPCDGRIVVVLDAPPTWYDGFSTTMFNNQKNLLIKLFARPYFDNFERLALGYLSENETLTDFNHFHSESDVDNYIKAVQQDPTSEFQDSGIRDAYEKNYPSVSGDRITIVFFVSHIYEDEIDNERAYAKLLQDQGVRVVLIGHSIGSDYYYDYSRLVKVTKDPSTVFNWDASKTLPSDDYQEWFKQVIGCSVVASSTSKPTIVSSSSKSPESKSPCAGRVVVVLDASTSWIGFSTDQFNDEKSLLQQLLVGPYFNHFERLVIGFYAFDTNLTNFGDLGSESDVVQYLHSIQQSPNHITWLKNALMDVYYKNYPAISGDPITVVIFVSDIEENEVNDAAEQAKQLQDQGVRLVLVGHGNFKDDFVDLDRLTRITGDSSTALKWDDDKSLPADDYQTWFKQVMGCSSS
ncbi:hypothetical protein M3Y95_00370900 [Aphelenchoides besseyi]|nr:hypothetical protein M3Y95_00370900 [Aphelenchoides besseyi]